MKLVTVGAGVLNQIALDWTGNAARINAAIGSAREQGVQVLCLPELCVSGYGCEDAFSSPHVAESAMETVAAILPETTGMFVSVGLPLWHGRSLYNGAMVLADGAVRGIVCKKHLAGSGVYYEPRWFRAWPAGKAIDFKTPYGTVPLGDVVFSWDGVNIAFEICEDAWVASRAQSGLAQSDVDIILNPSASHFAFDKFSVRKRICAEGSRMFGATYVYANLLGNESGRLIFDGGALVAARGEIVAQGQRFTYAQSHVISCQVDVDETRLTGGGQDSGVVRVVELAQPLADERPREDVATVDAWEADADVRFEEFTRAVGLGLFDYMRKSYSRGFVVSLSGGADSSATATLAAFALQQAFATLDSETLAKLLSYLPPDYRCDVDAAVENLLCCAYQATDNSSAETEDAAHALAEGLGATYYRFDVEPLVSEYRARAETAIERRLTWQDDDITLQNIQARVRGPMVWMLSNIRGALLLSTSNRSEAAVGYATMDGDTCGGVSPIAGIDKDFILRWLQWMEKDGPLVDGARCPQASLAKSNALTPTAELRPAAQDQTDERDLMPYPVLEAIEEEAVRDRHPPIDVWQKIIPRFPAYDEKTLAQWVEKFFRLFARNQWKRERYAPSFHLDDENLDPKTWLRFPILSAGFAKELAALRARAGLD